MINTEKKKNRRKQQKQINIPSEVKFTKSKKSKNKNRKEERVGQVKAISGRHKPALTIEESGLLPGG